MHLPVQASPSKRAKRSLMYVAIYQCFLVSVHRKCKNSCSLHYFMVSMVSVVRTKIAATSKLGMLELYVFT